MFSFIITGHILDDGRLDHHQSGQNHMAIYGATGALRSNSSNSSSPGGGNVVHNTVTNSTIGSSTIGGLSHGHVNTPAALLVVPQPINATKIGSSINGPSTGRKYQCKMCPQVNYYFFFILSHIFTVSHKSFKCKKKKICSNDWSSKPWIQIWSVERADTKKKQESIFFLFLHFHHNYKQTFCYRWIFNWFRGAKKKKLSRLVIVTYKKKHSLWIKKKNNQTIASRKKKWR